MTPIVLRGLRRAPAVTLAAMVGIALGAAAFSALVTLVHAALVTAPPFPAADRLTRVWWAEPSGNSRVSLSIPEFSDIGSLDAFDAFLGSARVRVVALLGNAGAERLRGEAVSSGYFETLGITPALGRFFDAAAHRPEAPRIVVLSHGLWLRRYGGNPGVLGQLLRTERAVYTIVAVAPPSFGGLVEDDVVDFWIPVEQYEPVATITNRDERSSWAVAWLRPGMSLEAASAKIAALGQSIAAAHPASYRGLELRLESFGENWRGGLRRPTGLLLGGAVLLLVIAATNVASLLLVRVLDRRRELAVRSALGANPQRLVWHLTAETGTIVAVGGALGLVVGPPILHAFLSFSPVPLPSYVNVAADPITLCWSLAALAIGGLIAGTAPALIAGRVSPGDVLKESGRSSSEAPERRWSRWLVAAETALTVTLLVAGGLLVRSEDRLARLDLGFTRQGVARLAVTINHTDVAATRDLPAFYARLSRALAGYPGVVAVGLVAPTLPPWDPERARVRFPEVQDANRPNGLDTGLHFADRALLPTLGVRLTSGRPFTANDDEGPTVDDPPAIISRSLAMLMGGIDRAIGRSITLTGDATVAGRSARVVGVADNVAYDGIAEQDTRRYIQYFNGADPKAARYDVYLPLGQFPTRTVSIGVRTSGDPAAFIEPLRRVIAQVAPSSPIHWTSTMDAEVAGEYASTRFYTVLFTTFAMSALALTGLGLFALLSHTASRRLREMGLRLALGAPRRHLAMLTLRGGLWPVTAGLVAGLLISMGVSRLMGGLVYEVPLTDIVSFAGASVVFVAVAAVASVGPARRATSADPLAIIRDQ